MYGFVDDSEKLNIILNLDSVTSAFIIKHRVSALTTQAVMFCLNLQMVDSHSLRKWSERHTRETGEEVAQNESVLNDRGSTNELSHHDLNDIAFVDNIFNVVWTLDIHIQFRKCSSNDTLKLVNVDSVRLVTTSNQFSDNRVLIGIGSD